MRDETRWAQARDLFLDLVELPETERERTLESRAGADATLASWVRDLLRHDARSSQRAGAAPRRLGPYELVRSIGRGGMGEVYVARRVDGELELDVAIKCLHKGAASEHLIRRFQRERQTLARLDHEYIARLLDAGTTPDGAPYLVMDLVIGEPADVFAARQSLRERLELFLRIGQAVQHAHERGFVHRDLKPKNILVRADGAPRLLDFGIARAESELAADDARQTESLTQTGQRLYTPEYASPEQVRGEAATAQSDVFALGVVLYEFLTGTKPWTAERGLHVLERRICEDDPVPPRRRSSETTGARLSADLDAIVLRCLAKRPEDRYASVAELCADVRRHLDGLPILARRTSALGRIVRHARRRPARAAAFALLVVALVLGAWNWISERADERRREELRAAVQGRIEAALLQATRGDLDSAQAEIDAALSALRELPGESALEAEALSRKAVFASFRGDWKQAEELVDQAFEALRATAAPDPHLIARLLNSRAYALQSNDPGERSSDAYREARDYALANIPVGDVLRVDAITGWALELRRAGRDADALQGLEDALREARTVDDPRRDVVSRTLNEVAVALSKLGRFREASERYREALEILAWNHGEKHPAFARVRFNLGTNLYRDRRIDEARVEFTRSLEVSREAKLEILVAASQQYLARIHFSRGELAEAETAVREALELRERIGPEAALHESQCLWGIVLATTRRPGEARAVLEPLFARAVELPIELEAEARHRLGVLLQDAEELGAARSHLERALELKREWLGAEHADCVELSRRLEARF